MDVQHERDKRAPSGDASILALGSAVLSEWKVVLAAPVLLSLLVGVGTYLLPRTYTASTAFSLEGTGAGLSQRLAGIAGQFGIDLGGAVGGEQSASFYAAVARSPAIVSRIVVSHFADPRDPQRHDSVRLLELLDVEGDSLPERLFNGRRKIEKQLAVSVDNVTNIVTLSFDSRYPALAAAVANRFVALLNEFNSQVRRSQAGERRRFVEERLSEAEAELRGAEDAVRRFIEGNRTWQQSPQLTFEHERLRRQLEIRQEVMLTLRREYETARIAEVNDTPVISVVYPATPPQRSSRPRRILIVVLSFVIFSVSGVLWALVSDLAKRDVTEYRRFVVSFQRARSEIGSLMHRKKR